MIDTHLGGCVCGAVRYRVHGNPVVGTVCHCRFCQKRLASSFAVLASFKKMPSNCCKVIHLRSNTDRTRVDDGCE